MTHISDGVTIGNLRGLSAAYRSAKIKAGVATYLVTPITLDRDGFCAAQTTAGAADLSLNGALVTNGVGVIDVPRAVGVYSAGNLSAITFTVYGYDAYNQPVREAITGPNATTANGKKAFARITRVAASAAVGTNVEVGTIDIFGLPVRITSTSAVVHVGWAALTRDTGTLTAADDTTATATTGDVRGTYAPSSAANGTTRTLGLALIPDLTSRASTYGVSQYGVGV